MHFLAGDIGGTRLRLRTVETDGNDWLVRHEVAWASGNFDSLETAVQLFLEELSRAERSALFGAWLAVAGPVIEGRVHFSNLPWEIDEKALSNHISLPRVHLVNDLEAEVHVIPTLSHKALATLQTGHVDSGRRLLISVGTGLGLASWSQGSHELQVQPSEGGHSDFAPVTEWQSALWSWMRARTPHVSYERLISGPGLVELYDFILFQAGLPLANRNGGDRTAEVVRLAGTDVDGRACAAVDHFIRMLGAFCGNAALHVMATGGIYLSGGVIRSLLPYLRNDSFQHAFSDKGRMGRLLKRIPVHVITMPEPGQEGITRLALQATNVDAAT